MLPPSSQPTPGSFSGEGTCSRWAAPQPQYLRLRRIQQTERYGPTIAAPPWDMKENTF